MLARKALRVALAIGALVPFSPAIAAEQPVALVEDVIGQVPGVAPMDYLYEGRRIELKAGQGLVIGYLGSCLVETVRGGSVVIGRTESAVSGGAREARSVACEGEKLKLTADQAGKSGVAVFRRAPQPGRATLPPAALTVHGLSPVLAARTPGRVTIERLDQSAAPLAVDVKGTVDLARRGMALAPGGLYRASGPDGTVVFLVDPNAPSGPTPVIGRLIRL
jgi:hypothetical protein